MTLLNREGQGNVVNTPGPLLIEPHQLPKSADVENMQVRKKLTVEDILQLGPVAREYIRSLITIPSSGVPVDGWVDAGETWTYASTDGPTFTLTVPTDLTAKYAVGQRIKLTQTTVKYFIVTKVAYSSPNTTMTLYGGTDYTLVSAAITSPFYSIVKAPVGFPLNPDKWTVESTKAANASQGTAVAGTWYNISTFQISLPIGVWRVVWNASIYCDSDDGAENTTSGTLSAANNSQTDSTMTAQVRVVGTGGVDTAGVTVTKEKIIGVTSKESRFLNLMTSNGGSTLWLIAGDSPAYIRAICAYL